MMKNILKNVILLSGLISNIIPVFCSNTVNEEIEKIPYGQVVLPMIEKNKVLTETEKNIKELRTKIISTIQVEDIRSLFSQPRIYTDKIKIIKAEIDRYSDNERAEFKQKLKDLTRWYCNDDIMTRKASRLTNYDRKLYKNFNKDSLKNRWDHKYFLGYGVLQILTDDSNGYLNISKGLLSGNILPMSQPYVPDLLDIYIKRSQNMPVELMVVASKIKLHNQVNQAMRLRFPNDMLSIDESFQKTRMMTQLYEEGSNEITKKIQDKLKIYFQDNVIEQVRLGGFPAKNSKDKKLIELFKKSYAGDIQKAYEWFIRSKFIALHEFYYTGDIHMEPRTTFTEIRQDYQKYSDLSVEYATIVSNKFGNSSESEKQSYKTDLLSDLEIYKCVEKMLADVSHPGWGEM